MSARADSFVAIYRFGTILLADILLMFLYLEVIGMVAVYYAERNSGSCNQFLLRSLRSDGWSCCKARKRRRKTY